MKATFGCALALALLGRVAPASALPAIGSAPLPKGPGLAVMIVLDISGGMNVGYRSRTWMWYANEAAAKIVGELGEKDYVGVIVADVRPYLVIPLQHPHEELEEWIRKLTAAGGGIYVYSALARAHAELERVEARRRHVLLLADASDVEEMCRGLAFPPDDGCPSSTPTAVGLAAGAWAGGRTTLTAVGLGRIDAEGVPALKSLAGAGRGRLYLTINPRDLPRIFVDEVRSLPTATARR